MAFAFPTHPVDVPRVETPNRRIVTAIPTPAALDVIDRLAEVECRSMLGQMPVLWDRAEGFQVHDRYGNRWIDFSSSIFVANAGHANPQIRDALIRELDQGTWHAYTYATETRARYLRRLIDIAPAPLAKAWLASAGSEATECAFRIIRLYAAAAGKRRPGIVTFNGAYHGRTVGAALMSGTPASRSWIGFDDPYAHRLDFPFEWTLDGMDGRQRAEADIARLRTQVEDPARDIAGIMLESYQGWAAAFYPPGYVETLATFARANGILIAFDDIQAGFGRSGRMFAFQHYDVEPDIACIGKGISSSLPLSAILARAELMDLFAVGSMSATHSAHPLCCAAGLANIEAIVEGGLVAQAERRGQLLRDALEDLQRRHPGRIRHVLGKGLMMGLLLADPDTGAPDGETASRVCLRALEKGLILVHTGRESIKIGPPLVISDEALLEAAGVIGEALEEVLAEKGAS